MRSYCCEGIFFIRFAGLAVGHSGRNLCDAGLCPVYPSKPAGTLYVPAATCRGGPAARHRALLGRGDPGRGGQAVRPGRLRRRGWRPEPQSRRARKARGHDPRKDPDGRGALRRRARLRDGARRGRLRPDAGQNPAAEAGSRQPREARRRERRHRHHRRVGAARAHQGPRLRPCRADRGQEPRDPRRDRIRAADSGRPLRPDAAQHVRPRRPRGRHPARAGWRAAARFRQPRDRQPRVEPCRQCRAVGRRLPEWRGRVRRAVVCGVRQRRGGPGEHTGAAAHCRRGRRPPAGQRGDHAVAGVRDGAVIPGAGGDRSPDR